MTPLAFDEAFRQRVRDHVRRYATPSSRLALGHLVATLAVYGACLLLLPVLAERARSGAGILQWASALALLLVLSCLVGTEVRTFMIHHDLCHGSFFSSPKENRWVAVLVGALVSTAPSVWKREHDRHHRDSNNLGRPQDGQTASWTVEQYERAPRTQRLLYWLVNRRPVLFGLLPPLYFFGFMRARARVVENVVFAVYAGTLYWAGLLGWFVLSASLASLVGFLLFHAQHTFDGAPRRAAEHYDFFDNGMLGSSFLVLPDAPILGSALRWFAYAVEYHHVHHLHPRVPGYRLRACHDAGGDLFDAVPRVTLADAVRTTRYSLYDVKQGRFTSLAEHPPW